MFQEDLLTQSIIDKMSQEDREKYYQLTEENEKLVKKTQKMQTDIKKSKEMIKVHMENISKSKVHSSYIEYLRMKKKLLYICHNCIYCFKILI